MADSNPYGGFLDAASGMFGNMLSNPWGGTTSSPSLLSGGSSGNGALGSIADLYNNYQSANTANSVNNQVQGINAAQQGAIQNQITSMQQQAAAQRATALDAYNAAKDQYGTQNTGLQGNIDTMTGNLNALTDPNSPYMQMARQAIERKDAAAGRRSQWGERETQLAGTLADYVGKYAPGLNNSITTARDEINKNNNSLANMYENMNKVGGITDTNITALINAMNGASTNANTTGRQAATASNNSTNALAQGGMGAANALIKALMGGLGSSTGQGISDYFGNNASQMYGVTGTGNLIGNTYGLDQNNYGPSFGGSYISDGLGSGANPYGYTSGLTNGGYSGDYYE